MTEWALPEKRAAGVMTAHPNANSDGGTRYAAPLNVAFNTPLRYFPWLELPENEGRLARFGRGMVGARQFESKNQILQGATSKFSFSLSVRSIHMRVCAMHRGR